MAKASPPTPPPKTFAGRLRVARLDKVLTLNELAIASGLGFRTVQSLDVVQK